MKFRVVPAAALILVCAVAYPRTMAAQNPTTETSAVASQIDPAKEADIRHLLELTGASALMMQSMNEMEKNIRPLFSNSLPPGAYREQLVDLFFDKFHSKHDPAHLLGLIIPIYDKYYSASDIKGLIQFYSSPLGKKMASALPQIVNESQAAGGKWGEQLGRDSMLEVLQEHPEIRKALEEAKANQQPVQ